MLVSAATAREITAKYRLGKLAQAVYWRKTCRAPFPAKV